MAKRKRSSRIAAGDVPAEEGFRRDTDHLTVSLARIQDPVLRYMLCMLVDRLTLQIAVLSQGGKSKRQPPRRVAKAA